LTSVIEVRLLDADHFACPPWHNKVVVNVEDDLR
jgi:hypothetical protein